MAVVVTGLEVFGDVGKCRQILWILSCTWDIADLVLCYDILQKDISNKRQKDKEVQSEMLISGKTVEYPQWATLWKNKSDLLFISFHTFQNHNYSTILVWEFCEVAELEFVLW